MLISMGDYFYSVRPNTDEDSQSHSVGNSLFLNNHILENRMRCGSNQIPPFSDNDEDQHHRGRQWTLFLFSITTILLFADQNLMSPNLTAIAQDFDLDDEERDRKLGGDISLAFFIVGAPASFLVGLLADTGDRSKIFGWTVFIGEAACLLTYFVQSYDQLYVCRAVTGFSVGGAFPVIYSILGDLFRAEDRHVVSAIISFGFGAGISLGQAVAGYLGPIYGWRLPFLVISVPAIICAVVIYLMVEDPKRGAMEHGYLDAHISGENSGGAGNGEMTLVPISSSSCLVEKEAFSDVDEESQGESPIQTVDSRYQQNEANENSLGWKNHLKSSINLLSTKTVALSLLQGAPGCIPWGVINVFLNDYLSEDRGFSVQAATTILMLFSFGYALGLAVGGAGGKFLYKIDIRLPALLAGGTAIVGCFPLWYLLNNVDSSTPFYVAASSAIVAGIGSAPTGPIIKATLTNVTLPRARGQAFALFNLFDDFGKGLGPYFVSLLIEKLGGRLPAFNVAVFGWTLCGIFNIAIFFTVSRDENVVQSTLSAQIQAF